MDNTAKVLIRSVDTLEHDPPGFGHSLKDSLGVIEGLFEISGFCVFCLAEPGLECRETNGPRAGQVMDIPHIGRFTS